MPKLHGRSILIVEDNPLNAMVLDQAVRDEGGTAINCGTAQDALLAIGQGGIISAGIVDNGICKAHPGVCRELQDRGIPYVLHQDLTDVHGASGPGQPISADTLIGKVASLLR